MHLLAGLFNEGLPGVLIGHRIVGNQDVPRRMSQDLYCALNVTTLRGVDQCLGRGLMYAARRSARVDETPWVALEKRWTLDLLRKSWQIGFEGT